MFSATSQIGPLPLDTETRLEGFAQLMWAAIATTDARETLQRLVDEQAALRHVAELVARESPPSTVIAAVVREAAHVLEASSAAVIRDEGHAFSIVADSHFHPEVGEQHAKPRSSSTESVGHAHGDLGCHGPPGRPRPAQPFADLIAAAIANATNRDGLTRSRARVIAAADDDAVACNATSTTARSNGLSTRSSR